MSLLHQSLSRPTRLVLPCRNPQSGAEGVQFGMPPTEKSGPGSDYSIMILHTAPETDEVVCGQVDRPRLENPPGEPPKPIWLWANVGGDWLRVGRPTHTDESVPLQELPEGGSIRWAPDATGSEPVTFGHRIRASDNARLDGQRGMRVLGYKLADVLVKDGHVSEISPSRFARDLELWTSHLIQLAWVHAAKRSL